MEKTEKTNISNLGSISNLSSIGFSLFRLASGMKQIDPVTGDPINMEIQELIEKLEREINEDKQKREKQKENVRNKKICNEIENKYFYGGPSIYKFLKN